MVNKVDEHCVFVTGGAGFIGSAVIREFLRSTEVRLVNIDSLTYAGNLETLSEVAHHGRYDFSHTDIRDQEALQELRALGYVDEMTSLEEGILHYVHHLQGNAAAWCE